MSNCVDRVTLTNDVICGKTYNVTSCPAVLGHLVVISTHGFYQSRLYLEHLTHQYSYSTSGRIGIDLGAIFNRDINQI